MSEFVVPDLSGFVEYLKEVLYETDGTPTGDPEDEVRRGLPRLAGRRLSQAEAARVLGVCDQTFQRMIDRDEGLKHLDDEDDALYLAHLMRLGLLAQSYIYPKAERAVRDLLRKHSQLVRQRTMNILSIEHLVARNSGHLINGNAVQRLTQQELERIEPNAGRRLALGANLAAMGALNEQIA